MKFGLSYNTAAAGTDPANLKAIARQTDDLGFESFYLPEHVGVSFGYPDAAHPANGFRTRRADLADVVTRAG